MSVRRVHVAKSKEKKRCYDIKNSDVVYFNLERLQEAFGEGEFQDGDTVDIYEFVETKKIKVNILELV